MIESPPKGGFFVSAILYNSIQGVETLNRNGHYGVTARAAFWLAVVPVRYFHPAHDRRPRVETKVAILSPSYRKSAMPDLDQDTRTAVVQHTMNVISFIQQIEEEIQTILEVLDIKTEFVPFSEDFPDPSMME
uniref:Uncharacterized protein n=2 Tax=Candidatus Kentrum eta TaxID=2126337 RepID=A0A450VK30_9GAMM|nr:MAG: hypothetical protein BECKH772B_GA0070898_102576 [Candidatus Kentron sp. H]VFK05125.1 MAG: hypothetical protein BECKH772C_GA0070978_102386 [Candidatus Kentron sp. H]